MSSDVELFQKVLDATEEAKKLVSQTKNMAGVLLRLRTEIESVSIWRRNLTDCFMCPTLKEHLETCPNCKFICSQLKKECSE